MRHEDVGNGLAVAPAVALASDDAGGTMPIADPDLNACLLAAHAAGDGPVLARLYRRAADRAEARGDGDAAAFFLTHAYVFALEAGSPGAAADRARLVAAGREA